MESPDCPPLKCAEKYIHTSKTNTYTNAKTNDKVTAEQMLSQAPLVITYIIITSHNYLHYYYIAFT